MTVYKVGDPKGPYGPDAKSPGNSMNFPGRGVAGNVAGAVGGFLSSGGGGSGYQHPFGAAQRATAPAAPRTPSRSGNTATQPTGARSTNGATRRTGWGLLGGSGWGGSARTTALASNPETTGMANSVTNASGGTTTRVRPGQQMPVTARNQLLRSPGGRAVPGGVAFTNASGGTTTRISNPAAAALPITPNRQRAYDEKAYAQTPESKVTDPNNWGGTARDLGNAGAKPWLSYATGDKPSTSAMQYVKDNPTQATAPATRRAAAAAPAATAATASAASGLASARPTRMSAAASTAKRRENAAPYRASLARRSTSSGTPRSVVRTESQRRALPVTPHNQARRRAAAGARNKPV